MVIAKGGGSGWVGGVRERDVYFKSDTYTCAMCIVFYRVSKSDLWSYMGGGGQDRKKHFYCKFFHMLTRYLAMTKHTKFHM